MTFSYLTCLAHIEVRDDVGGYMADYDSCGVVVPNLFQSNVTGIQFQLFVFELNLIIK